MKTYRQKLAKWIESRKIEESNPDIIKILDEIKDKVKSLESEEREMVNNAYEKGYIDGQHNRGRSSNFYGKMYKSHDFLSNLVKK